MKLIRSRELTFYQMTGSKHKNASRVVVDTTQMRKDNEDVMQVRLGPEEPEVAEELLRRRVVEEEPREDN